MTPLISPLSLNPLTRDLWGQYDASVIAQLAPYANDPCYRMKFYKAPADNDEVIEQQGFRAYGMKVTPGSLIFGFYLPADPDTTTPSSSVPLQYTVQVTDSSLNLEWFDEPVASLFLSNFKPCYQSLFGDFMGSFPNLMNTPWPVVGKGLFMVEIQSTANVSQRIELVLGVLEACG
jgi:hypothetical protein